MNESATSRLVLALRVAAASAIGSLAAVIVVGIQRVIIHPIPVDVAVVVVAALCVVAVLMVTSDQQQSAAAPVPVAVAQPTGAMPPHRQPTAPPSAGPHAAHRTPPPSGAVPPPGSAVPPPPEPAASGSGFVLTGGPTAGGTTGGLSWHEAAARGVAGTAPGAAPTPSGPPPTALPPGDQPSRQQPATQDGVPDRSAPPEQQEIWLRRADPERAVRRVVQCPRCGSFGIRAQQVRDGCAFECQACGHPWHWRPGTPWPPTTIRPRLRRLDQSAPSAAPAVWRMPS